VVSGVSASLNPSEAIKSLVDPPNAEKINDFALRKSIFYLSPSESTGTASTWGITSSWGLGTSYAIGGRPGAIKISLGGSFGSASTGSIWAAIILLL
jgi:hypothetical protein